MTIDVFWQRIETWGCPNCAHKSMDIYKSEESAIKAWNRRGEDGI